MKYDFDQERSREGSDAVKWMIIQRGDDLSNWQHTTEFFGDNRILPMWVADMDFPCPAPVVDALRARAEHGIFGYTAPTGPYFKAVLKWMSRRHGWEIKAEWITISPGVVPAINMLVREFVSPGEKVLVQPPVYYPFFDAIKNNGAELIENPLILEDGSYQMDFEGLEAAVRDPQVTLAILCSPHNPVGRVWTREELSRFAEICIKNNVLIVSDEIHGDLILNGNEFTPLAKINDEFAQNAIICTAPSKTFNLAGLQTSNIIIPNANLRKRFSQALLSNGVFGIGVFGSVALEAAYSHGEDWLEQVLEYIQGNLDYMESYVSEHIPKISVIRPEGTYLVWLDCRDLGLDKMALKELMLEKARVYLDEGYIFGTQGEGFERINIACPRHILVEALDRIKNAIDGLGSGG